MPARVRYTVSMSNPHSHLFEVGIAVDGLSTPAVDLVLPSWTPGSYMIREYARHVQRFEAHAGGRAASWTKIAKDCWRIECGAAADVRVRYEVYAHDLTVRTCHLDGSHGFFNGAATLMFVPGLEGEESALVVRCPEGWSVFTGLEPDGFGPEGFRFRAADFDELVDCPVECGPHRALTFEVDGIPHRVVLWGSGNEEEASLVRDIRSIVVAQRDFFGGLPYAHYTFIVHLAAGRGGLEHRNSAVFLVDRFGFRPQAAYERFLGLISHELFHVWNVKRIRPETLGPFDYRRENHTRQLWTMEGVTTYFEKRFLLAAGLISRKRFLELLAEDAVMLRAQPGRALQSLEQASFDAWIKHYRPDENASNSSISYYLKGCLVAMLLDLEIRGRTGGESSLDDVVRLLFRRYADARGGFAEPRGFLDAVEEITGPCGGAFDHFFERFVAGTVEPPIEATLRLAGLRGTWGWRGGATSAPAWLGVRVETRGDRPFVGSARSDGPAYLAGIYAGDELVAVDGVRVNEWTLPARITERRPGDTVRITIFRRDQLVEVPVTLAAAPHDALTIEDDPEATEAAASIRAGWLGE